MGFSLNLPSINILPINIEKLIGEIRFEINKIKDQSEADKLIVKVQQIFIEFQSFSSQLSSKSASDKEFITKRSMLHGEVNRAVQQVARIAGNSSAPQAVHMQKSAEVRPKIELLGQALEEAKKSYQLESDILGKLCDELLNITQLSDLKEEEKEKLINYINGRKQLYLDIIKRKYSVDN